jgi:succinate-semialdehyde dehydrogenase/glutarate-semialdehyde dehydrogenase
MPWNYPFWQVMRAAAPALMAGNTMLLKHASNVSGSALLLHDIVAKGTGGHALFETVIARSSAVGGMIADPRVAAATITGSERAGIAVAEACARNLKPSVLELGGSDAFIVLCDADVDAAARAAVTARFLNAGQSCIAGKRFIVVDAVAAEFEEAFASYTGDLIMGDPRDDATDLGPMARADLRDELLDQLRAGLADGGTVLTGGEPPDVPGAYFTPTVVGGVSPQNLLAREETFGPLAAVLRVKGEAEAVELANAPDYGLSSSLWTQDIEKARSMASSIAAGAVFVNAPSASDPRMPFGGVKRSGWGRELGSFGIREFVNTQAVAIGPKAG